MKSFDAVIRLVGGVEAVELRRWIEESWVRPESGGEGYVFREVDIARVRLIVELRRDLAIDEETLPVVLGLLDQVYSLRRRLRAVHAAVTAQPEAVRDAVLGALAASREEPGDT
jgi:chaperone modulatory protein CbpM